MLLWLFIARLWMFIIRLWSIMTRLWLWLDSVRREAYYLLSRAEIAP